MYMEAIIFKHWVLKIGSKKIGSRYLIVSYVENTQLHHLWEHSVFLVVDEIMSNLNLIFSVVPIM